MAIFANAIHADRGDDESSEAPTADEPIEAAPRYYGRSLERQRVLPGQIIAVANIARLFFIMHENLEALVLIVQPQ